MSQGKISSCIDEGNEAVGADCSRRYTVARPAEVAEKLLRHLPAVVPVTVKPCANCGKLAVRKQQPVAAVWVQP